MQKQPTEKCIALIGDPHLPGRHLQLKQKVIDDINSWEDVDLVVCVGDLCETYGTEVEFAFAAGFFAQLQQPFITLLGNHDQYYSDSGYFQAGVAERREKVERFRCSFPDQKLNHSFEFAGLRLVFLALDGFSSSLFSAVSPQQLLWFEEELSRYRQQTTVVFFHAPLWSSEVIKLFPQAVNYIAQPVEDFARIVARHEQIRLWVSGHVHFGMVKELITHPFNLFLDRVMNILTCDLDGFSILNKKIKPEFHDQVWTRRLYLSPAGFRCTVYDHNRSCELPELEMRGQF